MGRSIPWRRIRQLKKDVIDPNWRDPCHEAHLALLRQAIDEAFASLQLHLPREVCLYILYASFGLNGSEGLRPEQLARVLRGSMRGPTRERVRAILSWLGWKLRRSPILCPYSK
jgi:hypothetical protein